MKINGITAMERVNRALLEVDMRIWKIAPRFAALVAAGLFTAGCGGPEDDLVAGGVPPAGGMSVVSVTPVEAAPDALLENGSFEEWLVGAPVPAGPFVGPSTSERRSQLTQTTAATDGVQAMVQTWTETDWGRPTGELFSVLVNGLDKGANYRLTLAADTKNTGAGYVEIYPSGTRGNPAPLAEIEIGPAAGYKEHSIVFTPGDTTSIRIATRGPADPSAYPNVIAFDNWRVEATKDPITPDPSVPPVPGLIPNGNLGRWPTGQVQPGAPYVPPSDASEISRVSVGADGSPYAMRQRWTGRNSVWDTDRLFAVQANLKPQTRYTLSVKANSLGKHEAVVDIYGLRSMQAWYPLANFLIRVPVAEGWQEYSGTFDTGELSNMRITTATFKLADDTQNCEILWDDWTITEVGPSPPMPAPEPDGKNLITNGSFEVWVPGREAPEGNIDPPARDSGYSRVMPMWRTASDGSISLEQEWTGSDSGDAPENLFGVEFSGLKTEHFYRFSCSAYHFNTQPHDVRVYAKQENGKYMPLTRLRVGDTGVRDKWEDYSFNFETRMFSEIRIVAEGPSGQAFPYRVLWDNWRLEEVGP